MSNFVLVLEMDSQLVLAGKYVLQPSSVRCADLLWRFESHLGLMDGTEIGGMKQLGRKAATAKNRR